MTKALKLGFVPLTDAAPLIVAQEVGFFREEGLAVELVREVSWATVRDKVGVGALDGAHMLAPMALAASLASPFVLNRGGAAITLSSRIVDRGEPAAGLRRLVAQRREQGSSPLTFAVVFPQSLHAYLLRRWLSDAGLDPDRDVLITVAPPPRMADLLADGVIEGFSAGAPWSAAAVAAGAGQVVARASRIWPNAPDKVLALGAAPLRDPDVVSGLVRALRRATAWLGDPQHRDEALQVLSARAFVGVAPAVLAADFDDIRFGMNAPQEADGVWLVGQMGRAGQLDSVAAAAAARRTFRRDLYEAALGTSA